MAPAFVVIELFRFDHLGVELCPGQSWHSMRIPCGTSSRTSSRRTGEGTLNVLLEEEADGLAKTDREPIAPGIAGVGSRPRQTR